MAKQTKTMADLSTVNTVNSSQKILLTDANGNGTLISLADLKAAILGGASLNALSDGVFIAYHRNSDNSPLMVRPHKWPSLQTGGETAEGVAIIEGGKILVVAPTEAESLTWSSAEVVGGGVTTSDRAVAFSDWAGKQNTAAQILNDECNTEEYAPGFCAAYEKTNDAGYGFTAGAWWLPSLGEMAMIYANMSKVNYALSLINGADQLTETSYWASTESSSANAWGMYLSDGTANGSTKATYERRVRPVSALK